MKINISFLIFTLSISAAFANTHSFVGYSRAIPTAIQQKMIGNSWNPDCPVPLTNFSYVTLSYWGFDHQTHQGILIVNKKIANNVIDIFHQLYLQHFPIQQMQPMYLFNGDDVKSMEANNTSAFNCRIMANTTNKSSLHAYGLAIDINPLMNPYVRRQMVLPRNTGPYLDRSELRPGMISKNSQIYQDFIAHGWTWGGNWRFLKDYQHFEK